MDDDLELDTMEENFDSIPEEVRAYVFGSDFSNNLEALCTETSLTGDQKDLLKGAIFGFLGHTVSEEELNEQINDSTPDEAKRKKINDWIDENVTKKILDILAKAYAAVDEETEENAEEGTIANPDISPSLTNLADRLKKNSIATPAQKSSAPLDPYHEPIDN